MNNVIITKEVGYDYNIEFRAQYNVEARMHISEDMDAGKWDEEIGKVLNEQIESRVRADLFDTPYIEGMSEQTKRILIESLEISLRELEPSDFDIKNRTRRYFDYKFRIDMIHNIQTEGTVNGTKKVQTNEND